MSIGILARRSVYTVCATTLLSQHCSNVGQCRTLVPLWQKSLLSEKKLVVGHLCTAKRAYSSISQPNVKQSEENKSHAESSQKTSFNWKKAGAIALGTVFIAGSVYLANEGQDNSEKPQQLSKEVEEIQNFVQEFNQNAHESIEKKNSYHKQALLKLEEIKHWGGLTKTSRLHPDVPTARLCFVEMVKCEDPHVQLEALDHLNDLLKTGINPYATLQEIITLERVLGGNLTQSNILNCSPPILEQTIKAYVLVLEHLKVYLAKSHGQTSFQNKGEILARSKKIKGKLDSSSFRYHVACIDSLATSLDYQSRPVKNSIASFVAFQKQIQEPTSKIYQFFQSNKEIFKVFMDLFLKKNLNIQEWLKINKDVLKEGLTSADFETLEQLVQDMSCVGEGVSDFYDKLCHILKGPNDKALWYEKVLRMKSLWVYLPHDEASVEQLCQLVKSEYQSSEDRLFFYGAIELLGEVALSSQERLSVRKEAINSISTLLELPLIAPEVIHKIGELLYRIQQVEEDALAQQAEKSLNKLERSHAFTCEVRDSLAWFQEVQEKGRELYIYNQNLRWELFTEGKLPSFLLPLNPVAHKQLASTVADVTEHFIERKLALEQLSRNFQSKKAHQPARAHTQVITGLGGIGKTQLALSYIRFCALEYKFIYWIKAENIEKLKNDLNSLADILVPGQGTSETKLGFLKKWLEDSANAGWLIVFDNVDSIQEATFFTEFKKHLPRSGGHIVITSRCADSKQWKELSPLASLYPLQHTFSINQSIQYLKKSLSEEINRSDAVQVAKELGGLPLALAQAVGYLKNHTYLDLQGYLNRFREGKEELLKNNYLYSDEYPVSLAATWLVSMEEIKKNPHANAVLTLCSFLSPEEIPISFLKNWMCYHRNERKEKAYSQELDEALKILSDHSMLTSDRDQRSVSLHRLVQAIARKYSIRNNELSQQPALLLQEAAEQMVTFPPVEGYNPTRRETLSPFRKMLPHCESLLQHIDQTSQALPSNPLSIIRLDLIVTRYHLETKRNTQEAEKYLNLARKWARDVKHPVLGKIDLFQGAIHLKNARDPKKQEKECYEQALVCFKNARTQFEQYKQEQDYRFIEQNPNKSNRQYQLAISLLDQAQVYTKLSEFDPSYLKTATDLLKIAKKEFLPLSEDGQHFDIARILREKAIILQKQGRFEKAKQKIIDKVFPMQRKVYKERFRSQPAVAATYTTLGKICEEFGDNTQNNEEYKEADNAYAEAIQVNKAAFKTEVHTYIIDLYKKRANVLAKLGDGEMAKSMEKKRNELKKQFDELQ